MSRRSFLPYVKRGAALLTLFALVFLIRALILSIISVYDRSQILKNLKTQEAQLQKEQAYLSQKLYFAKTDTFVEDEARQKLGLVRPGEQIVVDQKIGPLQPKSEPIARPNWQKWWNLFF
ncbi:MAG: septum formation initiator family protein [Candidatus Levyibacteriota bacterium]